MSDKTTKPIVHGSMLRKIVASDLQSERDNCNFDKEEMYDLFGNWAVLGKETKDLKKSVENLIESDPNLHLTHKYYEWSTKEIQEMWMKKLNYLYFHSPQVRKMHFQTRPTVDFYWAWAHHGQAPDGLHSTMFIQCLDAFSTDEQRAFWYPKANNHDIIGCYAQTEIGHGSNVAGLETTATFDKKTDEFVIHSPTMTSTKWWPGDMGRYANFALVMARLVIESDGEKNDYGVVPFIVQIRSLEDHKYMPGVKCGDMGPKFGYHSKDNGWLKFN